MGAVPARRVLLFLVLGGLLARVIYLAQVAALPFFQDPMGDSARYLERADEILAGDIVGSRAFFYGGTLYPYLLAAFTLVFGRNLFPICLAQVVMGACLGPLLYRIALQAVVPVESARIVGLLAASLCLFYGPLAFLEADLLMSSWALLFLMGAAYLLLDGLGRAAEGRGALTFALAGLGIGLAVSDRPNLIALVPAALVWQAIFSPRPARARAVSALAIGAAVVPAVVAGLNYASSGRCVLLTTSTGINFYIGNHPGARGTFDEPWSRSDTHFTALHTDLEESSRLMAARLSGADLGAVEASSFWLGRGLAFLRENPGEALVLYVRKLQLFWNAVEIPNHLNFSFIRSHAPALWLMPLGFGVIGPLALFGLGSSSSRHLLTRPALVLLALLILVPMVTLLPFFIADRYRAPVMPPLILLSACGLFDLGRRLRDGQRRWRAAAALASVLLLGLVVHHRLAQFDTSRDFWLLAQAYKKQGNLPKAARSYERALEVAPENAVLHNNLGVVYGQMGKMELAEARYRRAIAIDPDLLFPVKNLGLLLIGRGETQESFGMLVRAQSGEPEDIDVARALSVLYLGRGDGDQARRLARKVLALQEDDPTALGVIEAGSASRRESDPGSR